MTQPPIIINREQFAREYLTKWKLENEKEYADFIKGIEKSKSGDYSTNIKIFEMAVDFIPQPVKDEFSFLFSDKEQTREPKDYDEDV